MEQHLTFVPRIEAIEMPIGSVQCPSRYWVPLCKAQAEDRAGVQKEAGCLIPHLIEVGGGSLDNQAVPPAAIAYKAHIVCGGGGECPPVRLSVCLRADHCTDPSSQRLEFRRHTVGLGLARAKPRAEVNILVESCLFVPHLIFQDSM